MSSAHAQQTSDTNSTTATVQIEEFPSFSLRMCRTIFDTSQQISYVCGRHRDLFPVLLMAERRAKLECERQFKNEFWNCSGFSLLKAPNISRSGKYLGICMHGSLVGSHHCVDRNVIMFPVLCQHWLTVRLMHSNLCLCDVSLYEGLQWGPVSVCCFLIVWYCKAHRAILSMPYALVSIRALDSARTDVL